jgi:hypothetical protein
MYIDRHQLAEIITQEVRYRLTELAEAEAEGGDGSGKRKRPKKPSTADAEVSPSPKGQPPVGPGMEPEDDGTEPDEPEDDAEPPDDAADASGDADDALDGEGDAGEDPTGAVNNEVAGKVIQAVTIEPQSKILPGAKEVVITFGDSSDALRILISKAGHDDEGPPVKFFWRGHIHDLP